MNENIDYTNHAVHIQWVDSYGVTSGWQDISEYTHNALMIHSFGVVIYQDADAISLAHNYADETDKTIKQANGVMTIPLACIKRIQVIPTFSSVSLE